MPGMTAVVNEGARVQSRVGSRVFLAAAMMALAFSAGCGDGGGNDGGGGGDPTPTRTATRAPTPTVTPTNTGQAATPTPTLTPAAVSTASVVFTLSASAGIVSASADVTYDPARGSFAGAGFTTGNAPNDTKCAINTSDTFVANDDDNGTLRPGLMSANGLVFPATITCTFDQIAGPITASDLTITSKTVAVIDANTHIPVRGDPNSLSIQVTVTQRP